MKTAVLGGDDEGEIRDRWRAEVANRRQHDAGVVDEAFTEERGHMQPLPAHPLHDRVAPI